MIKRTLKRTLSIVLTLVLIATTFFIFDPSVLKMDADALIGVETNPGLVSITTPQGIAPETVYLKPGTDTFQYFSNINVTDGVASGSKDATGTVSFKNQSSTDTKLYVNNLWHKVGKTGDTYETFAISNLELGITGGVGAQQSITLAGLSASNATPASGATVIGRGSNSATAVLNTSSRLKNATRGDVYMIEWAAVSTISGTKHVTFMYTGIYVPLLTITGTTARGKHTTALTNVPKAAGFGFITGAMGYAEVGNRTTAYTGTTFGANCAPLVGFVGQQNNGTAGQYTIPNCDEGWASTVSFPDSTPKTIMVTPGVYDANGQSDNYDVWTTYTNWGSYANPTGISGTNHSDVSSAGQMTTAGVYSGLAYEVVDTSRFTDFSQIPNFSAGYIRYYHDRGGDECKLNYIRVSDAPGTNPTSNGINLVGVDTSDHDDDEDKWRSRTYGLYPFGGSTASTSGQRNMYVMFRYSEDITTYDFPIQIHIGVGLSIYGVNKDAQRKGYCEYLTSVVDNVNDSGFSTFYSNMLTQARRLCDPTCTDGSTTSGCDASSIESKNTSIISANSGSLYFHVPETIYLQPSSSNNNFQYYVNYSQTDIATTVASASDTSGNFYFHYKNASKVTALYVESVSGAGLSGLTVGGQNLSDGKINIASVTGASTANISTTITAGSLSSHADSKLKWTLYYVDKTTNATQSVVAYSYVYTPYVIPTAAGARYQYSKTFSTTFYSNGTGWLTGFHTQAGGGGRDTNANLQYLVLGSSTYPSAQGYDDDGGDGLYVSGSGTVNGAGNFTDAGKSNGSKTVNVTAPTATLYVDTSRYNNFSQIPNLYAGFYVTDNECDNSTSGSLTLKISDTFSDAHFDEGYPLVHHAEGSIATTSQTYNFTETGYHTRSGTNVYLNITTPLSVQVRDKSKLRTAYNYYLENAPVLQPDYFSGSNYSTMMSYLDTVTNYLCNPYNTSSQTDMDNAAADLYNQVAKMSKAVTSTSDGSAATTTFNYQDIGGTLRQRNNRSDYLGSSTAYNRHYSTATNALITGQGTNPETISYFYGDTVYAEKNNYTGYTFKYAEVTKPFDGAAIVNNRSSNSNTSKPLSWDASTRTLTFKNNTTDTDNYNQHPGPGADGSNYYYIPVIPKTEVTLTYTATGTTSQVFMFGMGNDMIVPGTSWTDGQNLKSNYSTGNQTLKWTVPENIYYVTFRFGNQTANSTTTFSDIKITLKTAVPDEINNAAGPGIEWKMYYDPTETTVRYAPAGGTFNGSPNETTTVKYDQTGYTVGKIGSSTPAAPTRDGYTFAGWSCSEPVVVGNTVKTEYAHGDSISPWHFDKTEVTFTALWNPISYNIVFNANGGTGTDPAAIEGVKYDEAVTLPANPYSRTGYQFIGWNTSSAGGASTRYAAGASVQNLTKTNGADVTLYAEWQGLSYNINAYAYRNTGSATGTYANNISGGTVKINTGTAGASATASLTCGTAYSLIAEPATGYKFVGWYTAAPTNNTTWGTAVSANTTYTGRTVPVNGESLYARFDVEKYTITFKNNYTGTGVQENYTTLTGVYFGTSQDIGVPSRPGYRFDGWFNSASGGTMVYGTTSPITISDHGNDTTSITLYAHWTSVPITVNYNANGGSGSMDSGSFTYGSSFTPAANGFTVPAKKTVTFNANGGTCDVSSRDSTFSFVNWKSGANNQTYAAGTAVNDNLGATGNEVTLFAQWNQSGISLPTPTRTGFTFNGWFTQSTGGDQRSNNYKPTASETLYAHWTIGNYALNVYAYCNKITGLTTYENSLTGGTVQIGENGTAGKDANQNFDYDTSLTVVAVAASGYQFDGWYTSFDFSGTAVSTNATYTRKMPNGQLKLYAKFSVIYYNVTANAYSNTASAQTTWANNTTGGSVIVTGGGVDGTSGKTSTAKVVKGSSTSLSATAATGYTFKGWFTAAPTSSSTASSTANPMSLSNVTAAATWYAKFDINTSTLTVKPNGGSWNSFTTDKSYTQAYGSTLSIPVPTRTGYTFSGWTKSGTFYGTLSSTTAAATYTFPANSGETSTITAGWTAINYSITYVLDGGTQGTNHPASAAYDSAFAVSAPTKTGYTFTGWTVTSGLDTANAKWGTSSSPATALSSASTKCVNGTSDVYFKNLRSTTGSVTLTANWTIKQYTVKLHAMTENNTSLGSFTESTTGGTVSGGTSAGTAYNHGASVTISASAKTGYTFAGWYSNAGMTTSVSTLPTTVTADIEYWAKFTVNKYTIKFNANTGTGSMSDMTNRVYGISYNLTQNAFTKTGYTFNGWNTAANGSGTAYADKASVTSLSSANNGVVTLYAQWKINKYTVTLHAMTDGTESTTGGTVSGAGTFDYGTTLNISASAKTGYTFDGWFSNSGMTTSAAVPSTMGDANVELWAKFSIIKNTLTVYAYSNNGNSNAYANNTTGGTVKIGTNGTAGASATANVNYGSTATIIAAVASTGYTFDGWYTDAAMTARYSTSASVSSESMDRTRTYYAKFTAQSFTITLDRNGGAFTGTDSQTVSVTAYYNGTATLEARPTKPGYQFVGWSESSTVTTATYGAGATLTVAQVNNNLFPGKTLYAVWKEFTYADTVLAASNTAADQSTFKVNTTGGTATLNLSSGDTFIKTGETILDKLTITPATGYELAEVRYAVASAPAANANVTTWNGSGTYNTNDTPEMPQLGDGSSVLSVVFIAYFKVKTYEVKAYAMSNSLESDSFENNAAGGSVKCGATGATGATATAFVPYGDTNGATFYAEANSGYTFAGWYSDAAMTQAVSYTTTENGYAVKVVADSSESTERWAKFTINTYNAYARAKYYTEGFDTATGAGENGITGGTVKVETANASATTTNNNAVSVSAKYTEDVTYTATPATGYEFVGWYYCENTNTADDADIESEFAIDTEDTLVVTMPEEDIRIHAKFVPYNFIIVLDPDGGVSGPTAAVTVTYGQSYTLDSTAKPTKSGETFIGWSESSGATTATYDHTNSNCTISDTVIKRWYDSRNTGTNSYTIYAVWTEANYTVTLDNQGATNGATSVTVTLDDPMPTISNLPTYDGYKFEGYFTEPGGKGTQYYNNDGTSAKNWNIADNGTLYAKWVCPVLKNATYDEATGKWTYVYETTDGGTISSTPQTSEVLTPQGITDKAPDGAKEITSIDNVIGKNVETKNKETADIDLNHYTKASLDDIKDCVTATNTEKKRDSLSQPQLNAYVSQVSYDLNLAINGNKRTNETIKPSIKIYETKSKLNMIKQDTIINPANSATEVTYEDYPKTREASSYVYTNKWCARTDKAVDYYIYTNSKTPVIALELDDGAVASTIADNKSSYPTNAVVSSDYDTSIATTTAASDNEMYKTGAVAATDNITEAWFAPYVKAGIGVGDGTESSKKAHDYNAKTILYLTPTFTTDNNMGTANEVVYTIKPQDDAYEKNEGFTSSEIANVNSNAKQPGNYSSLSAAEQAKPSDSKDAITICVSYHYTMNGVNDEGGEFGDSVFQMAIDQIQDADGKVYFDKWLNQMHLFRTSAGASNWELPTLDENVYPVDDATYAETGYVYGSFAYVFDETTEPLATISAENGNYSEAKDIIIANMKVDPLDKIDAIRNSSDANHLTKFGLGFFEITGWSNNYYPKQGSYVYAHLIDRWGNVFNRVWKNFNVEDVKAGIAGSAGSGFTVNEAGGSHLASFELTDTDINFITDLDSSFENDVFTTSGNTFVVSTNKPASKLPLVILDHAGNKLSGKIPTDLDGNIKFTVTDSEADLTSGAYTFEFNDKEVNLYARDPALVRSSEANSVAVVGEGCKFTITTLDNAAKVQLIENGQTRTYTKDSENVTIVDNGDGTLTWTIAVKSLSIGDHTFSVKSKDTSGVWHDTDFELKTTVIAKPKTRENVYQTVYDTTSYVGEKAVIKFSTAKDTQGVRIVYDTGYSKTVSRSDDLIVSCVDDVEVWKVTAGAFSTTGEHVVSIYVEYNDVWQKDVIAKGTVTVTEKPKASAGIYSVDVSDDTVESGAEVEFKITTSAATDKIQFVLPTSTKTIAKSDAAVVDNGDGSLTWTVTRKYTSAGENEIILKARSAAGWTEAQTFGTITVA